MQLKNKFLRKNFFVADSGIHGKGLFAKSFIREGQYMGTYIGPRKRANGSHVLWVKEGYGLERSRDGKNILRYMNHSDEPNAAFEGFDLYALRNIRPREEITIDYGEEPDPELVRASV